jgi:NADH-quinone oxidoreductase subunit N
MSPDHCDRFYGSRAKAAFAAFARVFLYSLGPIHAQWKASFGFWRFDHDGRQRHALVQSNVKRMLAYSSVAHAGYLLVAMVAGKNWRRGDVLFGRIWAHESLAFGVIVAVGRKGEPNEEFADFAGLGFKYPLLAMAMTVFMLSLTGVPPLVGFTGKFYIFSAAVKAGYIWLAVIGVLNSVVSAYYYIRVVVNMYMYDGDKIPEKLSARPALALAILLAAVGTVLMGILPAASMALARTSFLSLG